MLWKSPIFFPLPLRILNNRHFNLFPLKYLHFWNLLPLHISAGSTADGLALWLWPLQTCKRPHHQGHVSLTSVGLLPKQRLDTGIFSGLSRGVSASSAMGEEEVHGYPGCTMAVTGVQPSPWPHLDQKLISRIWAMKSCGAYLPLTLVYTNSQIWSFEVWF